MILVPVRDCDILLHEPVHSASYASNVRTALSCTSQMKVSLADTDSIKLL